MKRWIAFELVLIAVWVLFLGRDYLDFSPNLVPAGREYGSVVASHHFWTRLRTCGLCALWDGSQRGGFPALANVYAGVLHPVTAVTTMFFGVINGSKLIILISLWFAGLAQWWLSREIGVNQIVRIWSALIAVTGGHLASRMELGLVSMLLSTSMVGLVFPSLLNFFKNGTNRSAAILALVLASAWLSGQGYLQYALLASSPAALFLLVNNENSAKFYLKKIFMALGLSVAMAAVFLVPLIHFLPNFGKWTDPNFPAAQPVLYALFNLVIGDHDFYRSDALSKLPLFNFYPLFIGWIPVVLAIVGLAYALMYKDRKIGYLAGSAALIFAFTSPTLLRFAARFVPPLAGLRFSPYSMGLVVPAIIGISSFGLHQIFSLKWPTVDIGFSNATRRLGLSTKWLLLLPLIAGLWDVYNFSKPWYSSTELPGNMQAVMDELRTPTRQWVATPFGEHFWIEPAVRIGLALSPGIEPFFWEDRELPLPKLEASRTGPPAGDRPSALVTTTGDIGIYIFPDEEYAQVQSNDGVNPCLATANGGRITVQCSNESVGTLVVKENMWKGWKAWLDGEATQLDPQSDWLQLDTPGGDHHYEFKYIPVDAVLGAAISTVGILFTGYLARKTSD